MKRTHFFVIAIVVSALAVGGWLWCEQSRLLSECQVSVLPPKIGEEKNGATSNTDTPTQIDWRELAMEWPADVLDVSRWEKHEFKEAGVEALLPQGWKQDERRVILPEGQKIYGITIHKHPWPEYFEGKIGKEFSVAEAIMSKYLVYDDGYNFMLQGNRFNEISLPIGTGVEYPRLSYPFLDPSAPKHDELGRRLFILFSEKTKETYSFQYGFPQDSYNPVIDRAFEEMVKSARVLE